MAQFNRDIRGLANFLLGRKRSAFTFLYRLYYCYIKNDMRGYRMIVAGLVSLVVLSCVKPDKPPEPLRVPVDSFVEFERLGLEAKDVQGEYVLAMLTEIFETRVETSTFTLLFREPTSEFAYGQIIDYKGRVLEAIAECGGIVPQSNEEPDSGGCTHVFPPELEWVESLLHPERYRGAQCGNIATIHSAVQLGLLSEEDAFTGEYLNQDIVRILNVYHEFHSTKVGMNDDELQDAHKSFANSQTEVMCIVPLKAHIDNKASITGMLQTTDTFINSDYHTFDCSLSVYGYYGGDDKPRIAHIEHITSIQKTSRGTYEITTVDGFNQGKTDAAIPKSPGTNTWEFGCRMGMLKDGPKKNMDLFGLNIFKEIAVNCCYAQPR